MASVHPVTTPTATGTTRTWQVRWRTADGKQHKRNFKKKSEADKWATRCQAAKDRGEHGDPQRARTKLATYIEDTWWPTKINLKPKTADSYRGIVKWEILPAFGTTSLARIQSTHIEQWLIDIIVTKHRRPAISPPGAVSATPAQTQAARTLGRKEPRTVSAGT